MHHAEEGEDSVVRDRVFCVARIGGDGFEVVEHLDGGDGVAPSKNRVEFRVIEGVWGAGAEEQNCSADIVPVGELGSALHDTARVGDEDFLPDPLLFVRVSMRYSRW